MATKRRMTVDDLLGPELSAELQQPGAPAPPTTPTESPTSPTVAAGSDDPFAWDEPTTSDTGPDPAKPPSAAPPAPIAELPPSVAEPAPQAERESPTDEAADPLKAPLPPPGSNLAPRPPQPGQSIAKGRIPSVPRPKAKPKMPVEPVPTLESKVAAPAAPAPDLKELLVNVPTESAAVAESSAKASPTPQSPQELTPPPTDERAIPTDHQGGYLLQHDGFPSHELGVALRALGRWFWRLPVAARLGILGTATAVILFVLVAAFFGDHGPPQAYARSAQPLLSLPLEYHTQDPRPALEPRERVSVVEERGKFSLVRTGEDQIGWVLSANLAEDLPALGQNDVFTVCYRRVTEPTAEPCMVRAAEQTQACLLTCATLSNKIPCEVECKKRGDECRLRCPHTRAVLREQERMVALPDDEPENAASTDTEPVAAEPPPAEPADQVADTDKDAKTKKKTKKRAKKTKVKKSRYSLP